MGGNTAEASLFTLNNMRDYVPTHEVTQGFFEGMQALRDTRLIDALAKFSNEPPGSPCYGLALANKAIVELYLGRFEGSEASARQALAVFETLGCPHSPSWVQTVRHLGDAILEQGRPFEAAEVLASACMLADSLTEHHVNIAAQCELEKAHALCSMAGSSLRVSGPEAAIDCLDAARKIYKRHPRNAVGQSVCLENLAAAYTIAGNGVQRDRS